MSNTIYDTKNEINDINQCRRANGMAPIVPKMIPCMECGKLFESWFPDRVRHCSNCNGERYRQNCGSMGIR
jgi:hypothetical protein